VVTEKNKTTSAPARVERAAETSQASVQDREPMTGAQATCLKTLAEEMHEPQAYNVGLSRHEASRRIDALKEKLRLDELPPHTD
jgi:hypothetical protein